MATYCYTDLYLPASFKGFPCEAIEAGSEHGRRGAEGEFLFGEDTAYADLGRKIRTYSMTVRFVENDHLAQANAFLAVCESPGPGTLVHPTRGIIQAACRSAKAKDEIYEGQGITIIELEFVEANDWVSGFSLGASDLLGIDVSGILDASENVLNASYIIDNVPYFEVDNVLSAASDVVLGYADAFYNVTLGTSDPNVWLAYGDFERMSYDPGTLKSSKGMMEVVDLGSKAISNYSTGAKKFETFRSISNRVMTQTRSSVSSYKPKEALISVVRAVSAAYMAKAALEETNSNLSAALVRYNQISAILQQEISVAQATCNDAFFLELRNLLVSTQTKLLNKAYNLPALISYDLGGGVHSIVAAYAILGDARRVDEIEQINSNSFPWSLGPQVLSPRV